jgi:hypothetical protein
MNLFTLIFSDNSKFIGEDLKTTKWQEIPDKSIRSIFYSLPSGDMLCLANFKRIYHYIEVTEDITGGRRGIVNLEFSHLLIERENKILHYKINLKNNNINLEILDKEDKYVNSLNPIGWKKGL